MDRLQHAGLSARGKGRTHQGASNPEAVSLLRVRGWGEPMASESRIAANGSANPPRSCSTLQPNAGNAHRREKANAKHCGAIKSGGNSSRTRSSKGLAKHCCNYYLRGPVASILFDHDSLLTRLARRPWAIADLVSEIEEKLRILPNRWSGCRPIGQ